MRLAFPGYLHIYVLAYFLITYEIIYNTHRLGIAYRSQSVIFFISGYFKVIENEETPGYSFYISVKVVAIESYRSK